MGGAVRLPGVIGIPTWLSVEDILTRCGGTTSNVNGFLTGWYGGAWVGADHLRSATWAPDPLREVGGVIGAGILWALDAAQCPLQAMARVATYLAGESAGQYGPCRLGLPSVAKDRAQLATLSGGGKHPDCTARFISTGFTSSMPRSPII